MSLFRKREAEQQPELEELRREVAGLKAYIDDSVEAAVFRAFETNFTENGRLKSIMEATESHNHFYLQRKKDLHRGIDARIEETVRRLAMEEIRSRVEGVIGKEKFLDDIVKRIKDKQL